MKFHLVAGGLIFLLALLATTASARVYVGVGIGTSFGHHYPHYYGHHYPHYRWYGGYRSHYYPWYRHSYYPGYYYSPGSSWWVSGYYPIVINPKPAKTEGNPHPPNPPVLSQSVRRHRSEQIKVLKIGTKENRLAAIGELMPLSYDPKVRAALEDVLLSDPDPELRKLVATLFGKTENANFTTALKTAKAKDPDRTVRQAAYRAIIMIEGY